MNCARLEVDLNIQRVQKMYSLFFFYKGEHQKGKGNCYESKNQ